jgi:hypothetical protein
MPVRVEIRVDPRQSSVGAAVFSARTRIGVANLVMGAGETMPAFDEIGVALSEDLPASGEKPQRLRVHGFACNRSTR